MDSLAYLQLAVENEASEVRDLNLQGLTIKAATGFLGVACAIGVVSAADPASAHGYSYYPYYPVSYDYNPCYSYYPDYYSYYSPYYSYYPDYYSYYSYYYPYY